MQESLSAAALSKNRWSRALVTERAQFGLRHHLPDALDPAALYAALRYAATGLQRPSACLRRSPRGVDAQGNTHTNHMDVLMELLVVF